MNCPGCDAKPRDAAANEERPFTCGACGGVWMNASGLNRLLLHNELPGIEALRTRRREGGQWAVCRSCAVDLTCFEGGDRDAPQYYELCEGCGCVFVQLGSSPSPDFRLAEQELVTFFRSFVPSRYGWTP